jgi:hypothetical protein
MTDYSVVYVSCPVHERYRLIDETGCRECYRERAKASEPAKPRKIYQLPKQSAKKAQREKELSALRKKKKQEIKYCETCGVTGVFLSYSHIVKVSGYMDLELHPENAILECIDCHTAYEHGSLADKMKQKSWPRKLAVILKLEPAYFNKLQLKS